MFRLWHVFRFIGFLVLLGLLVFGGVALFNAGWSQGLMAASAPAASTAAGPQAYPYGYGMHPHMFFPGIIGFGLGLIPVFFLILLVFTGIRFLFAGPFMWHGNHGRNFGPCGPFGHFHHHMGPPDPEQYAKWYQEWEKNNPHKYAPGDKPDETPKSGE